jgi:diaminopimelate epimerase
MKLKFTKMQGAGNDFVVIDGTSQPVALEPAQWRRLADRHFGIGADQMLLVERPTRAGVDFRYRIFNADGAEVEHCGNGARCFLRFVHDRGLSRAERVVVETVNGLLALSFAPDGRVAVDMGEPRLMPTQVPFDPTGLEQRREGGDVVWRHPLPDGRSLWLSVLSMGNPHAVCVVDDLDAVDVAGDGAAIERSAHFPQRVNVGFLQVLDRGAARLRVWERGAGETLACGTGACAAVVAGIRRGLLDDTVEVHTRGGDLRIHWAGGPVTMTGPAETVFEGEIEL